MKFIYVLFLFCLTSVFNLIHAQDVELSWGSPAKKSKAIPYDVLGEDETGYYTLKYRRSDIYLEKFDRNLNFLWDKKIEIYLTKTNKTVFENIILINNKVIVFTSFYDSKINTKKLFATHISSEGVIDTKLYEVISFDNLESRNSVFYDVTVAEKNNSILIFSNFKTRNKEKEQFHYKVMDDNFVQKNQAFIELPYSGINTSIVDYTIDNAGNIHLVYKVNLRKEEAGNRSNDDKIDFNYYILSYYPATKEYKEYDLRVGDYVITGISVIIDKDSRYMYVPGFYSEKKLTALKGTFISKIDLINKKVVYAKEKDLDPEFLSLVYAKPIDDTDKKEEDPNKKKKTKAKEQLWDYDIIDLFVNEKEEVVLVSEQYYIHVVTTTTTNSNGGTTTRTTYYYYYNNVMVTKFGSNGDRLWCSNIPKFQVTTNDGGFFSSIGVFEHKDMLYVIYNDNPKNGTGIASKQFRTYSPQKSQLAMISIDSNGKLKKQVLMPAPVSGKGIGTRPKFCEQISDDAVILIGYQSSTYKLGKIDLK
jgi:hypothetical protein